MKLKIENVINKHRGEPCVLALHGPSLNPYLKKIQELQKIGYKRISVNQWYDYFESKPDYWVVSNTEFTIYNSVAPNWFWDTYNKGWPKNIFNKYNIPLLYSDVADLTSTEFIEQNLHCDYLPYDTKHFKNRNCTDILKSFRSHYEKNKNFEFTEYGNNKQMWKPLSLKDTNCHPSWVTYAGAWSRHNKCCAQLVERLTIQEELQQLSGHAEHIGPGTSVGIFALIFAVLMGHNPIYICGMDMDYSKGYANPEASGFKHRVNKGAIGHLKKIHCETIESDLRILRESAALLGIDIINLNKNSWFGALQLGDLP
jgi:hypothetical protein